MIGNGRPVEQDALRILTIVHQLGERPDRRWFIDSEHLLRPLDHLVRHRIDLAHVLMDQVRARPSQLAPRRAELARRVRQLLAAPPQPHHRQAVLRPFEPGPWERLDDVLAYLGCRGLLQVESLPSHAVRFRLTDQADRWLRRSVYPAADGLAPCRERCALLRDVLDPDLLRPEGEPELDAYLQQIDRRLATLRREEQIPLEEDMLSRLFQISFLEPL